MLLMALMLSPLLSWAQDLNIHVEEYSDCFGRTTLYPAKLDECLAQNYDSNNAILWSGEMAMLLKENLGSVPEEFKTKMLQVMPLHFSQPGLLSRHPHPYRYNEDMKPISFDEYHGLAFLSTVIPEFKETMDQVVEYGQKNHWQFWDMPGHEKGKPLWSLLTFSNLKLFFTEYLQEDHLRRATLKYPSWYPLFATHHLHQRAFYKMTSKSYKANFFEEVVFATAGVLAANGNDNFSSMAMWMFRYKALNHLNYDSKVIKWSEKYFKEKLTDRFGPNYPQYVFQKFYKDQEHPFHLLALKPNFKKALSWKREPSAKKK